MPNQDTTITVRDPVLHEGEPEQIAVDAAQDLEGALRELSGFAQRAETAVVNGAMQDCLDAYPDCHSKAGGAYGYAIGTREVAIAARANGALAVAHKLAAELIDVLAEPALERNK